MPQRIIVQDYDPGWPKQFEALRQTLWPVVCEIALAIEHVGSTAVPGLAAKPVIDVDIVIASQRDLAPVIERLQKLGYEHRGNLGIEERDAFHAPAGATDHHLYVCIAGSVALRNHLLLRDRLRRDGEARKRYAQIKHDLANRFADSIDDYVGGKTAFILELLKTEGTESSHLESIRAANESPTKR